MCEYCHDHRHFEIDGRACWNEYANGKRAKVKENGRIYDDRKNDKTLRHVRLLRCHTRIV